MKTTAQFWNDIAESYARKPVEDPAAFERKIELTRARLRPDHVVLDVGCGTGSLALRLAGGAAEVHGLDVSTEMIRIAEAKTEAAGIDNVRFHVGAFDERFDAFAPESLDMICAYSILHLIEDRAAALERMARLLRPGGALVASTVCLGGSWIPYRAILWTMRRLGKAPWVAIIDAAELVEDLRRAGFVDVEAPDVGAESSVAFLMARRPG